MAGASPTTFIFAGGGTGGHIFPALAIADELDRLAPGRTRALFLVSERPLDAQILGPRGREFAPIAARPFGLRPLTLARFVDSWGKSVRQSRQRLAAARRDGPAVVVAMGGFVAAPAAQAARVERAPLVLVNLDASPGKANRWIARRARAVLTSAPAPAFERRGWTRVPPIVRREARASDDRPADRARMGLDPARSTLLVTGASQGAGSINDLLIAMLERTPEVFRRDGWQVLHQCGRGKAGDLESAYARAGVPARVAEFIDPMGPAWGAADLALARAGAGAVAEVWANRVPAVLLPYPWHKDQHQRDNAEPLARAGGAVIETDLIDPQANLERAGKTLGELMRDAARRERMRAGLASLGPADGAERVASALLGVR